MGIVERAEYPILAASHRIQQQVGGKGKQYGEVLCRFADVVHGTDLSSKVVFGGISSIIPSIRFMYFRPSLVARPRDRRDGLPRVSGVQRQSSPESADTLVSAGTFREAVLRSPGIRNNIEFWDGEWNVIANWRNSNESVQARYVPRYFLQAKAQRVEGFLWEFIPGTDGSESDQYGLLHGDIAAANTFQPREAYKAFSVTSALFGQTERDLSCEVLQDRNPNIPQAYSHGELREYCYRDIKSGKPIYVVWLAVYAAPEDRFKPVSVVVPVPERQIENPILIDVRTGKVTPAEWHDKEARTIEVR